MLGVLFFGAAAVVLSLVIPLVIFAIGGFSPTAPFTEIRYRLTGTEGRARKSGRLRVGWIGYSPVSVEQSRRPASSAPDDQARKWAVRIANELGGVATTWTPLAWNDLIAALVSWKVDLVIDPILASPERLQHAQIVPYTIARDGILVFAAAQATRFQGCVGIADIAKRSGSRIGVTRGTTDELLARGLPHKMRVSVASRFIYNNVKEMMGANPLRLHAMLTDEIVAERLSKEFGEELRALELSDGTTRAAGVMVRARDAAFAERVRTCIAETPREEIEDLEENEMPFQLIKGGRA